MRQWRFLKMAVLGWMLLLGTSAAWGQYGGGGGDPNDPYLIADPNHMHAIGANPQHWDKDFKQVADIDLSAFDGEDGRPSYNIIGNNSVPFTGRFRGGYYIISGLMIFGNSGEVVGLFGYITDAEIHSVQLLDVFIYATHAPFVTDPIYTGGLCGHACGDTRIENCSVEGLIYGSTTGPKGVAVKQAGW